MTKRQRCPRCGYTRAWNLRRAKRRCARCRYEWRPGLPLRLRRPQWTALLRWPTRGLGSQAVARETGLTRTRVLRALLRLRQAMCHEVPPVFRGTVEVDETYVGGTWKNKRRPQRTHGTKRGRGTSKPPVFGILCRGGQVWAQVVPAVTARTLLPLLRRRVRPGSVVCSDPGDSDTGVAAKGYVHRLEEHGAGQFSDGRGSHINGWEGFWGSLKRRLAANGGIRRERLPLDVAEYVWRYNHRRLSANQQVVQLVRLLQNHRHVSG